MGQVLHFLIDSAAWLLRGAGLFLVVAAIVPFARTGSWLVRVFDFPRFQFGIVGVIVVVLVALLLDSPESVVWCLVVAAATVWQVAHVAQFTPIWPVEVRSATRASRRLVTANLDVRNGSRGEAAEVLDGLQADELLLIETDQAWMDALANLRAAYPHRLEHVEDDGLGMVLWSRSPISEPRLRFLVSDDRVSVDAVVQVDVTRSIRFRGLHPTPPALPREHGTSQENRDDGGRHDSRIRDAELGIVAREVGEQAEATWIVTGDFNDVAWSRTTRLFKRISGLLDPRVGRGLLNTYHARYPLLRYPLDHVMVSPDVAVARLDRVKVPGSDHFGIVMDYMIDESTGGDASQTPGVGEPEHADEVIRQGMDDARAT